MLKEENPMFFLDPISLHKICQSGSFPRQISISLDVGRTQSIVKMEAAQIVLSDELRLPLPQEICDRKADERTILQWNGNEWQKWQMFDEATGKFYKMVFVGEGKPPTVEISGIKMHVTEDGDPMLDTKRKLRSLGHVRGRVLDTCCGLGYSAIAISRLPGVTGVVTVEKDANMIRLCRENPWSRELFNSEKITLVRGDAAEFVETPEDASFAGILHDPPRYALAPELYELSFYRHCYRILRRKGRLYHYAGNPQKRRKSSLAEHTMRRLKQAGFDKAQKTYQGVRAVKI